MIVALSNIENWVSTIYHDYCDTLSSITSMEIFHSQGGIEKKIKLTDAGLRGKERLQLTRYPSTCQIKCTTIDLSRNAADKNESKLCPVWIESTLRAI